MHRMYRHGSLVYQIYGKKKRKHFVPPKPKSFPLTPHASGKWMKKINGKLEYFGRWGIRRKGKMVRLPNDGKDEAKAEYEEFLELCKQQAETEVIGKLTPGGKIRHDKITLAQVCNLFLDAMYERLQTGGKLSYATLLDYRNSEQLMCDFLGKRTKVVELLPNHFIRLSIAIHRKYGVVRTGNSIKAIKTLFKWAAKN